MLNEHAAQGRANRADLEEQQNRFVTILLDVKCRAVWTISFGHSCKLSTWRLFLYFVLLRSVNFS